MNNFDFSRFKNVACWDLAINRTFYTRMFILVAAIALLPMLAKYLFALWAIIALGGSREAYITMNAVDNLTALAGTTNFLLPLMLTVLMGYMFHNLVTRQGRINELTLPATNWERFLWHFCLIVGGGLLTGLASILLADLLHVLLGWAILGQTSFQSYTLLVFKSYGEVWTFLNNISTGSVLAALIAVVASLINYSLFALGSAWRYRYSIAYTLLYMFAASLLFTVLMGFIASAIVNRFDNIRGFLENLGEISFTTIGTVFLVVEVAVLAFIWWLTYRLYCRAQITTRRNP
ncbi:MAG: hypothetical protein IJR87_13330 [Bacteroidaceae bacterium]|nr:hypothetical protein [Bacteroidaceae bacterium]